MLRRPTARAKSLPPLRDIYKINKKLSELEDQTLKFIHMGTYSRGNLAKAEAFQQILKQIRMSIKIQEEMKSLLRGRLGKRLSAQY